MSARPSSLGDGPAIVRWEGGVNPDILPRCDACGRPTFGGAVVAEGPDLVHFACRGGKRERP